MTEEQERQLLTDLRNAMLAADPMPSRVRDVAVRAHSWDVDAALLADVVFDSLHAEAAMRGHDDARDLTFATPDVRVDITITGGDGGAILDGTVSDREALIYLVQPGTDELALDVDAHGRFQAEPSERLVSLRIETATGLIRTGLFSTDPADPLDRS